VREVETQLRDKKVTIALTDAARDWLAVKGYDPDFGARPMARVIQTELKDKLSEEMLFGKLARGGKVTVDAADGELVLRVEDRAPALA
jgi:ATP-dependent Clp protease ATP-binding subunit ClpA